MRGRHDLETHAPRFEVPPAYFCRAALELAREKPEPGLRPDRRQHVALELNANAAGLNTSLRWLMLIAALILPQHAIALDGAAKQSSPFTAPMPPHRPQSPSVTHGTPSVFPAAPAIAQPVPQQEALRRPRLLPPASRARMHACGLEWQKLKETGSAADKTWFEFARVCLAK